MGVPLSKLITDVGLAVQNANAAIERYAAEAYLVQGYVPQDIDGTDEKPEYHPVTYRLNIPTAGGKKAVDVPATALMNHTTLSLEQVDVRLKFVLEESTGEEVMVRVKSTGNAKEMYSVSELAMQFKTSPPSEGTARVENRHIQSL